MLRFDELLHPGNERIKNILEAAKQSFIKYGFRKTTMEDVAEEAGISKPTLYKYFENKESLLIGAMIYSFGELYGAHQRETKGLVSVKEKLRRFFEKGEEFIKGNKLVQMVFSYGSDLGKVWTASPLSTEAYLYSVDYLEKLVREGIRRREFRDLNPRLTAHALAMLSGLLVAYDPEVFMGKEKPKNFKISTFIAEMILKGLAR